MIKVPKLFTTSDFTLNVLICACATLNVENFERRNFRNFENHIYISVFYFVIFPYRVISQIFFFVKLRIYHKPIQKFQNQLGERKGGKKTHEIVILECSLENKKYISNIRSNKKMLFQNTKKIDFRKLVHQKDGFQ